MNITDYLKQQSMRVEAHLDSLVPVKKVAHRHLYEAARYSLLGPGKRIRPILTLATNEALGGNESHALTPACALELIHTYSLIHDDLPCMDNDDFRRGKPTLHRVYPEGHAVLTGDYLLTHAFDVLCHSPGLNESQKLQLVATLAQSAGGEGMIAGQVLDISAEGKQIDLTTLQQIHLAKTAALLTAAITFGGVIANASMTQMESLKKFGHHIGLAFQIVDDILDVTACEQKHGRSSDLNNNKTTYVSLLGLDHARDAASTLLEEAKYHLGQMDADTSRLVALAELIVHRSA